MYKVEWWLMRSLLVRHHVECHCLLILLCGSLVLLLLLLSVKNASSGLVCAAAKHCKYQMGKKSEHSWGIVMF